VRSGWSGCSTQIRVSLGGCLSCTTWSGVGKMGRVTGKEGYNKKRFSEEEERYVCKEEKTCDK
jgi:hypothetical protein